MSASDGVPPAAIPLDRPVLITGGAGFIGTNLASRLAGQGHRITVFDNLSRAGVERNLAWLRSRYGELITPEIADIRDREAVSRAAAGAGAVFHLAAQVAVTTSLGDPVDDFAVNAGGTLSVLEAVRAQPEPPPLLFTSTNKVYGRLADLELVEETESYRPRRAADMLGIDESCRLDFHSPYGCSKGAGDQYVIDYGRTYGLRTLVFRMSCIYGPHQCGNEDQGWVAHFIRAAQAGRPITLYGTGKQVRDILWVEDLVDAFECALTRRDRLAPQAFNIGGGSGNAVSLRQVIAQIERLLGRAPALQHGPWRPGDQPWYVSDTARFARATGWVPKVGAEEGIEHLFHWLAAAWQIEEPAVEPAIVNARRRAVAGRTGR